MSRIYSAKFQNFSDPLYYTLDYQQLTEEYMMRHSHIREYMMIVEGKPGCKICAKPFASVGSLSSHIEVVHLKLNSYKCQYCEMTFSSKSHRSVHIHRHHRAEHREFLEEKSRGASF